VHGSGVPYEYEEDEAALGEERAGPFLTRPAHLP